MNSVENNFVPYQIALDMKSIGFHEPCIYVYLDKATIRQNCGFMNYPKEIYSNVVKAPLYQQTFKFFREKYNLFISIVHYENGYSINDLRRFETYEEAELACLKKLIEIVKSK